MVVNSQLLFWPINELKNQRMRILFGNSFDNFFVKILFFQMYRNKQDLFDFCFLWQIEILRRQTVFQEDAFYQYVPLTPTLKKKFVSDVEGFFRQTSTNFGTFRKFYHLYHHHEAN